MVPWYGSQADWDIVRVRIELNKSSLTISAYNTCYDSVPSPEFIPTYGDFISSSCGSADFNPCGSLVLVLFSLFFKHRWNVKNVSFPTVFSYEEANLGSKSSLPSFPSQNRITVLLSLTINFFPFLELDGSDCPMITCVQTAKWAQVTDSMSFIASFIFCYCIK